MKNGPFTITSSEIKYQNPWIIVREEKVIRPDGEKGLFGTVEYVNGASVVAIDKSNYIYLIKEYRYGISDYSYEIPTGAIDEGETELEAAKRELFEESGVKAEKWTSMGYTVPITAIMKARNYMFLAEDLEIGTMTNPENDVIEVVKMPFNEALQMVMEGKIWHATSALAIIKVARLKNI
jgi:8-oxo-dGTP pyrophosphatase MutT (NUDIX family)